MAAEIASTKNRLGHAYCLNATVRKAVELHAQGLVEDHFVAMGFDVADVSGQCSFDLRCIRDGVELHIEVKGTIGGGDEVVLTRAEVEHARAHASKMVLAIVSGIELETRDDGLRPRGGQMRLIWPWIVDDGTLTSLQFKYRPPTE